MRQLIGCNILFVTLYCNARLFFNVFRNQYKNFFVKIVNGLQPMSFLEILNNFFPFEMISHGSSPLPPILGGDLKLSDQNNSGGLEQKIKFGGS